MNGIFFNLLQLMSFVFNGVQRDLLEGFDRSADYQLGTVY